MGEMMDKASKALEALKRAKRRLHQSRNGSGVADAIGEIGKAIAFIGESQPPETGHTYSIRDTGKEREVYVDGVMVYSHPVEPTAILQADRPVVSREAIDRGINEWMKAPNLDGNVCVVGPRSRKELGDMIEALQLPTPQPVAGQVGEALEKMDQALLAIGRDHIATCSDLIVEAMKALRQPVETVGDEKLYVLTEKELRAFAVKYVTDPANGANILATLRTQPQDPVVEVASVVPEPSAGLLAKWAFSGEWSELDKEAEAFAANFKHIPDAASRGFYVGWKLALLQRTVGGGR